MPSWSRINGADQARDDLVHRCLVQRFDVSRRACAAISNLLWAKPLFREPPCHSLLLTHGAHFFIQDEE
jgi:hypothetical protein